MSGVALASKGRHRTVQVIPEPPTDQEKYSYVLRMQPFLTTALVISSLFVVLAQVLFEVRNTIALPFVTYTAIYAVYQLISLPTNFVGRGFNVQQHRRRVASWHPWGYPTVDVYLPICGEGAEILRNTWIGVFELIHSYPGEAQAYVLDDGPSDVAKALASDFGFVYIRRPNLKQHKKSGNLKYAFDRTEGDFIVIFDADFRPRADFLTETLPYMEDRSIGLVQTPQFFRATPRQTWVERAAGVSLEVFYRAVQVCRDRVGSALCVGSNAVYRRAALDHEGGFTLIPYAEDSHTGLDMRRHGYQLKYLPIVLAAGVCPSTMDMFMKQQYRWCCGATSLNFTNHMWRVKMPWTSRMPYVAGWLWNFTTGLRTIMLPLIPITLLIWLPDQVRPSNVLLLIPALITGALLYPLWHNNRYPLGMWPLAVAVGWAQALALWDYARGKVMSWQPSRGPADATRRFKYAVVGWNGSLALVWLGAAVWRTAQTSSPRFAVVAFFGVINVIVIGRIIFPGRAAR